MLIRIRPNSDVALFEQIATAIRTEIAAGRIAPGERLPAAREIAVGLDVNLHTVLHAYQSLRDEGLVDMRRGRGAVVTAAAEPLAALHSEIVALAAKGRAAGVSSDALAALMKEVP